MKSEITELNVTQTATTLAILAAIISLLFSFIGIIKLTVSSLTDGSFIGWSPMTCFVSPLAG